MENYYNILKQKIRNQKKDVFRFNYHKCKIEIMKAFNNGSINDMQADDLINYLS